MDIGVLKTADHLDDGIHFAVEQGDDRFVARALTLLADREKAAKMGAVARRLVVETMGWPAMLAPLPALVGREAKRKRQRYAA